MLFKCSIINQLNNSTQLAILSFSLIPSYCALLMLFLFLLQSRMSILVGEMALTFCEVNKTNDETPF